MNKIVLISENGEANHVLSMALDSGYIDGQTHDGLLAKHIDINSDDTTYIDLRYWDFNESVWKVREKRPSSYMVWIDGAWVLDSEELLVQMRRLRDNLLTQSDWTQFPDSPLSDTSKAEWTTYRQALRDIPETYSDATSLDDIIWPTKPE